MDSIRWLLVLELASLCALPLCLTVFRPLHDRGYALAKPFGLLAIGYVFWLLNSFQVLPNTRSGIGAAVLVLMALAVAVAYRSRREHIAWLRLHWRYVASVELLFAAVFFIAAALRAHAGQMTGSESNMDFMFLNASLRADHFPPKDPWLAGATVSYYYFGFVLVALLTQLAHVAPEVGYNLGIATVAALTIIAAFGVSYNLIHIASDSPSGDEPLQQGASPVRAGLFGLAGAALVALMGNLVWVFAFASSYGIGNARFYRGLDIGVPAGLERATWYPSGRGVFGIGGQVYRITSGFGHRSVIQFPMFSFLLGDLHAHMMALPFVLLAVALIAAATRSRATLSGSSWVEDPLTLLVGAVILGSLGFLNSWDLPVVAAVFVVAVFAINLRRGRLQPALVDTASYCLPLLVLAVVAYAPFYASFDPDAGGLKPVVDNRLEPHPGVSLIQFFTHWGPLLAPIALMLGLARAAERTPVRLRHALAAALLPAAIVGTWVALVVYGQVTDSGQLRDADGLWQQIADRGTGWLTDGLIATFVTAAILALWRECSTRRTDIQPGRAVALALTIVGLVVIQGTQFFYVDDYYNTRLNTVFKLYYSAWALLALAAAYALYEITEGLRTATRRSRWAVAGLAVCVGLIGAGLLYPVGAIPDRIRPYVGSVPIQQETTLDGLAFLPPDERAGIEWLRAHVHGQDATVAESTQQVDDIAFEGPARISAMTGIPTVLGSPGHVDTWRRNSKQLRAGRIERMDEFYATTDVERVKVIARAYRITLIYVGVIERARYSPASLAKFDAFPVAFRSGDVVIYEVPPASN